MGGSTRSPASASRSRPAKRSAWSRQRAGKTTLVRSAHLCAFDSGAVGIFGASARRPGSRRRLAYVPERFGPPHYLILSSWR